MAMQSGFFNSKNGDRRYKADFFSEYFASFIGNGVFPNPSNNFRITANNDMTVTVGRGKGWINGTYCVDKSENIINIDVADGVLNRIDRIVLRLDVVRRDIQVAIKKGEFSNSPVAKELQRDPDAYELGLADIYVNKGAIGISQSNVTDLRLSPKYCGIVHGVVDQVDTSDIFNQYMDWYQARQSEFNEDLTQYKKSKQEDLDNWHAATTAQFEIDFNVWFATIKDILDENVAANLLNKINELREELNETISSLSLPLDVKSYSNVSQWSDILIPDKNRGLSLLSFFSRYEDTSDMMTSSEQAMLVMMEEERFSKERRVPSDYEQIINKLGKTTSVGQCLAWVEELTSDHARGIEKLEIGLLLEQASVEIASNEYAVRTIMDGERYGGINNYRYKSASQNELEAQVQKLEEKIELLGGI